MYETCIELFHNKNELDEIRCRLDLRSLMKDSGSHICLSVVLDGNDLKTEMLRLALGKLMTRCDPSSQAWNRRNSFGLFKMSNKISHKSICERNTISMSEKYNESCMKFTNEELKNYLIDNIKRCESTNLEIRLLSDDGEEIDYNSDIKIETIVFDGENKNLFISFYGVQTSIFSFGEEIMFIDEKSKGIYTSSDVHKNAVYEGSLREMTHEEMLHMFAEIIICFIDATGIRVIQSNIPDNKKFEEYRKSNYYDPHMFIVNVEKEHIIGETTVYQNIIINS